MRRILDTLYSHHFSLDQFVGCKPRDTPWAISHQSEGCTLVQTCNPTRSIDLNCTIRHSGILRFSTCMALNLQEAFDPLCWGHYKCSRKRRKTTSNGNVDQTHRCLLVLLKRFDHQQTRIVSPKGKCIDRRYRQNRRGYSTI